MVGADEGVEVAQHRRVRAARRVDASSSGPAASRTAALKLSESGTVSWASTSRPALIRSYESGSASGDGAACAAWSRRPQPAHSSHILGVGVWRSAAKLQQYGLASVLTPVVSCTDTSCE